MEKESDSETWNRVLIDIFGKFGCSVSSFKESEMPFLWISKTGFNLQKGKNIRNTDVVEERRESTQSHRLNQENTSAIRQDALFLFYF